MRCHKSVEVEPSEPTAPTSPIRIKRSIGGSGASVISSVRFHNKTDSLSNQSPIFTTQDEPPSPLPARLRLKPVPIRQRFEQPEIIKTSLLASSSIGNKDEILSPLLIPESYTALKVYQKRQRLANSPSKLQESVILEKHAPLKNSLARKPYSLKNFDDLSTSSRLKNIADFDESPYERHSVKNKSEQPKISSFTVKKQSVAMSDPKKSTRAIDAPVNILSASVDITKENYTEE